MGDEACGEADETDEVQEVRADTEVEDGLMG